MTPAPDRQEYDRREALAVSRTELCVGPEPQPAHLRGTWCGVAAVVSVAGYLMIRTDIKEDGKGVFLLFVLAFAIGFATALPARLRWRKEFRRHAAFVQAEAESRDAGMQR